MAVIDQQFPMFQKAMRTITAITNDFPALVTTDLNHQYVTGQIVRIYIPFDFGSTANPTTQKNQYAFGMVQINGLSGRITVTSLTQFTIDIDTRNFDAFVIPPDRVFPVGPASQVQYAQVVPIGQLGGEPKSATVNILPYPVPYPPLPYP